MSKVKELPTREYLLECFRYDRELGKIFWNERPRSHFKNKGNYVKFHINYANKEAGSVFNNKSLVVKLDGINYKTSRIIWKLEYGEDIVEYIEHIDGDYKNNKICNLKKVIANLSVKKKINHKQLPSQEYLLECFRYDEKVGKLYWKERPRYHFKNNASCNRINRLYKDTEVIITLKDRRVVIDGKCYVIHKIVWKIIYGVDTNRVLRHIDGDIFNNKIENLEEIIPQEEIKKKLNEGKEKPKALELPTQKYLMECFTYDPDTGILYWKERPIYHFKEEGRGNSATANKIAGSLDKFGYIVINMDTIRYRAHRIIWKLVYGTDPVNLIDHINGIRDDNRLCNLREATHLENSQNVIKIRKNNKSGYVGVNYIKKTNKWTATIKYENESFYLGTFATAYEAHLAREAKAKELQGEFYVENDR